MASKFSIPVHNGLKYLTAVASSKWARRGRNQTRTTSNGNPDWLLESCDQMTTGWMHTRGGMIVSIVKTDVRMAKFFFESNCSSLCKIIVEFCVNARGLPCMTSALRGEGGTFKSRHSKQP